MDKEKNGTSIEQFIKKRNFSKLKIFVSPLRNKLLPKIVQSLFHVTRFIPDGAEWNIEASLVNDAKN